MPIDPSRLERPASGAVIVAGPSGSGKGTLAARLVRDGVVGAHLSMGDLLRALVARAAADPAEAAAAEVFLEGEVPAEAAGRSRLEWLAHCLERGLLIPDAWTQAVIARELARTPEVRGRWALDGYPRRVAAAEHLLDTLDAMRAPVWRVIHLRLDEDAVVDRLAARGRPDDTPDAIRRRYAFYEASVRPALAYLERRLGPGSVASVDAAASVDDVYARALAALEAMPALSRDGGPAGVR